MVAREQYHIQRKQSTLTPESNLFNKQWNMFKSYCLRLGCGAEPHCSRCCKTEEKGTHLRFHNHRLPVWAAILSYTWRALIEPFTPDLQSLWDTVLRGNSIWGLFPIRFTALQVWAQRNREINPVTVKINNRSKKNLDSTFKYRTERVYESHLYATN